MAQLLSNMELQPWMGGQTTDTFAPSHRILGARGAQQTEIQRRVVQHLSNVERRIAYIRRLIREGRLSFRKIFEYIGKLSLSSIIDSNLRPIQTRGTKMRKRKAHANFYMNQCPRDAFALRPPPYRRLKQVQVRERRDNLRVDFDE